MDLKRRTNLQQPQVTKAIKNLETRNLIKAVKSVEVGPEFSFALSLFHELLIFCLE